LNNALFLALSLAIYSPDIYLAIFLDSSAIDRILSLAYSFLLSAVDFNTFCVGTLDFFMGTSLIVSSQF
jgi:hypothetical protein